MDEKIRINKNAFQYYGYHPLQWPPGRGVSAQGDVCLWGCLSGGCAREGRVVCLGGVSIRTPPVNRITDRCKNITFANFVWAVKSAVWRRLRPIQTKRKWGGGDQRTSNKDQRKCLPFASAPSVWIGPYHRQTILRIIISTRTVNQFWGRYVIPRRNNDSLV